MQIIKYFVLLNMGVLSALAESAKPALNLRGIGPEDVARITAASLFECDSEISGKMKSLPLTAVNDDYCDCLDGTDEPGSGACSGRGGQQVSSTLTKFYCKNEGFESSYIPSSRVNDGICEPDCCDGSDEWQGRAKCPNVCAQLRIDHDLKLQERRRVVEEGLKMKKPYLDFAKTKMVELKQRKTTLQADIQRQGELVKDLEVKKEQAAKMVNSKNNSALYGKKLADISIRLLEIQDRLKEFEITMDELNEYNTISPKEPSDSEEQHVMAAPHEPEISVEEMKSALQEISLKWASLNLTETFREFNLTHDPVITTVIEQQVNEDEESFESQQEDEDDFLDDMYKKFGQYYSSCVSPYLPAFVTGNETIHGDTDGEIKSPSAITRQLEEAKSKFNSLTIDLESLDKQLNANYGPDNILMKLEGECFDYNSAEYVYEICPFAESKQKQNGNTIANLGRWQPLTDNSDISVWKFTGGAQCWNGPQRSMTVRLQCGNENKILSATEPNKCEYEMEMTTPLKCSQADMPH